MLPRLLLVTLSVFSLPWLDVSLIAQEEGVPERPVRALLICGGCCHDYAKQHKILFEGIQQRGNLQVDVWWTDDKSTNPPLPLFQDDDWAKGYDIIIHDECAAANRDVDVVKRILNAHKNIPAVHLHCAMHSFRNGTDLWFEHLGLQSTGHGPHLPLDVKFIDREHPVVVGMQDWTIEKDELYNNAKMFGAHPLAMGRQMVKRKGVVTPVESVVIWTNEIEGVRSFSMSIGHYSEGVADGRYLDLVTRGALWACRKLKPENLIPFEGENQVTFFPSAESANGNQGSGVAREMPKNPTLVHVSASSVQEGHPEADVLDRNPKSRWCASGNSFPQWIELDFEKPQELEGIRIQWESPKAYQYRVVGESADGKTIPLLDQSGSKQAIKGFQSFENGSETIKKIRIEGLGSTDVGWCSIREVYLRKAKPAKGNSKAARNLKNLWPADKNYKPLFQPTPAGDKR